MDGREQHDGDTEAQDPTRGREYRHVHVVEHEGLLAQHREAVEVLGPLMMGDRDNRCLQPRHVRLEGGRVVELGSHDELIALGGRYRTMFDLQASRFTEEVAADGGNG